MLDIVCPTGAGLPHLVSTSFQVLFHSAHSGSFHLSLAVLVHYRSPISIRLTPWSAQIHTKFHVHRITQEIPRRAPVFGYGPFTLYGAAFQKLHLTFALPHRAPTTPPPLQNVLRLRMIRFFSSCCTFS